MVDHLKIRRKGTEKHNPTHPVKTPWVFWQANSELFRGYCLKLVINPTTKRFGVGCNFKAKFVFIKKILNYARNNTFENK